jgi:hypothetical protein
MIEKSIWTESLDVVANIEWSDFVFLPNYAIAFVI